MMAPAELAGHYVTDPPHTFVTFAVRHFKTSTVTGRFDGVEGTVDLDTSARGGSGTIAIAMDSISTGTAAFDKHLKSAEFFDVEQYPQARFVGAHLVWQGGQLTEVQGTLTLLGQTHPVALRCTHFGHYDSPIHKAQVVGGDFEVTIQRSRWGMNWGIEFGVPDDVRLVIQFEAVKRG